MQNSEEVRGSWSGSYRYFASEEIGDVPFRAKLVCKDGVLTGMTIEPHFSKVDEVKATIEGVQEGSLVRFEKRYMLDGEDYNRVINYEGTLASDAKMISGTWRHSDGSGSFEMTRLG